MNRGCVNVQIYYIYYFNNSKTRRDSVLPDAPRSAIKTIVRIVPKSAWFRSYAVLAARAVPPVRRELVNRRRKRDISVFLSDDRIWIAFPEENRGPFLIVPHLGNRVYGRVKLGKNPLVG